MRNKFKLKAILNFYFVHTINALNKSPIVLVAATVIPLGTGWLVINLDYATKPPKKSSPS